VLADGADDDYVKFVSSLENTEPEVIPTPEVFLEEIEARERLAKGIYTLTTAFSLDKDICTLTD